MFELCHIELHSHNFTKCYEIMMDAKRNSEETVMSFALIDIKYRKRPEEGSY
jgi:hypothetical protein